MTMSTIHTKTDRLLKWQWIISSLCLVPLVQLVGRMIHVDLGPDPGRELVLVTGVWGFRLLLLTLAVTPLRIITGYAPLIRFRRTLGLFALLYLSLHFLCWTLFLLQLRFDLIGAELLERPYITVGFVALLMLIPLGITSTRKMRRRLGHNWQRLHRLIYPIALLGSLHFLWLSKDYYEPMIYTIILLALLAFRIIHRFYRRSQNR